MDVRTFLTTHPRMLKAVKSIAISTMGAALTVLGILVGLIPEWMQHPMVLPYVVAGCTWLMNTVRNLLRRMK